MNVKSFLLNPFQENTYLIYDDSKELVIIDPGCYDNFEERIITEFIEENNLNPVLLLNTHTHIDHVFGNRFIEMKYGLKPRFHKQDQMVYDAAKRTADIYGLNYSEGKGIGSYIKEGEVIQFGTQQLETILVPGHSPGHLVFYSRKDKIIIGGDVLFKGSIGRTDLPGGNHEDLIDSIEKKLFILEEDIVVYPGHGEPTTIGEEKASNPFFK